jgi:hypothetical protein
MKLSSICGVTKWVSWRTQGNNGRLKAWSIRVLARLKGKTKRIFHCKWLLFFFQIRYIYPCLSVEPIPKPYETNSRIQGKQLAYHNIKQKYDIFVTKQAEIQRPRIIPFSFIEIYHAESQPQSERAANRR